jgi:ATP-dependent DNA helicase DinG
VLDEGHLLETEIVKFKGLSISKRRWKRYIDNLEIIDYGYDDIERWVDFLIDLETKMLVATDNSSLAKLLAIERNVKYNYCNNGRKEISAAAAVKRYSNNKNRIVSASELFDSDYEIKKNMLLMMIY